MQPSCIAGAGGNRSSIVITIQDSCPGCPANQLALHPLTFARLANLSRNAIPVRYRQASAAALWPAVPQLLLKAQDERLPSAHLVGGACPLRPSCCPPTHTPSIHPSPLCQVACQPPDDIQVVVEAYNLGGEGWLRLHLEQASGAACWLVEVQCLPQSWGLPPFMCCICVFALQLSASGCQCKAVLHCCAPMLHARRWAAAVASSRCGCAAPPWKVAPLPQMPPRRGCRPSGASSTT